MQRKRPRDSLMVHEVVQHKREGALGGKETWEGVFFEQGKTSRYSLCGEVLSWLNVACANKTQSFWCI